MEFGGRRSVRLHGFDYTTPGAYFVTICTHGREALFGEVVRGAVDLSAAGWIALHTWQRIPRTFPYTLVDEFMVMPDHVHGILLIEPRRGEALDPAPPAGENSTTNASPLHTKRPHGTRERSLPSVIQNYKSVCARHINQVRRTPGKPVWQRNYYEHVIRGEAELRALREYIAENPVRWEEVRGNTPRP